jgi:phosphate transport system protein
MHRDLDQVKRDVLIMGGLVEEALQAACLALSERAIEHVQEIFELEIRIDRLQLDIDDQILKILALHQPVASDLRFVMAAMKIVNDLERIGDLACAIAKRLPEVLEATDLGEELNLVTMMDCAASMVSRALNSFVELDVPLAHAVLAMDDTVDDFNREHFTLLMARMQRDPESVPTAVGLLSISRSVERIADLATNVAEDVVFISTGEDIRHPKLNDR